MTERICVVTGCSAGIGKVTAAELARLGHRVVMVCRGRERGEAARAEIARGAGQVDLLIADLSLQTEIRRLADELKSRYDRIDVLINNAAVVTRRRTLTAEGVEQMYAVNHLAYFLLTNLLLETLKASGASRIVNVSSNAHRFARRFDIENLQGERKWSVPGQYAATKLENIYFTYALARRLAGTQVTVNGLHPGAIRSELSREIPAPLRALVNLFFRPLEEGSRTPVYLAVSPKVEGVTGKYFDNCREKLTTPLSYDQEASERLWKLSAQQTGLEQID